MIKKIIIVAGGTGGHVFPAYSLFQHFKKINTNVEIITDKRGLRFLKDYQNIKINTFLSSTISRKNLFKTGASLFVILISFISSLFFFLFKRPNIILGMGGYTTFPVCIAAKLLAIPFVIYENNLILGKANKYLLPFAKKIFLSYPEIKGINLKYKKKIIITGNIIRKEILDYRHKNINKIKKNINILVLGGSQAAKVFAEKLPTIFNDCKKNNIDVKIFQQCLPIQNDSLKKYYELNSIEYEIFNFNSHIIDIFKKIDLVITRSGASILAELLNCKIPFISIPLKFAADNHQYINAKYFEEKGYNFLIEEGKIESNLFPLIKAIHKDKSILHKIVIKQKNHTDKKVFEKVENEIKRIIDEKH